MFNSLRLGNPFTTSAITNAPSEEISLNSINCLICIPMLRMVRSLNSLIALKITTAPSDFIEVVASY